MKRFLPALLIVSLFAIGCGKQKAEAFNKYMDKARAVVMEANQHATKTASWFRGYNGKNGDKFKDEMAKKIKEMEGLKAKMAALSTPNDEIKKFQNIHVEMMGIFVGMYQVYGEMIADFSKAQSAMKKMQDYQKKLGKLAKEEEDLRQKYAKKHGLTAK